MYLPEDQPHAMKFTGVGRKPSDDPQIYAPGAGSSNFALNGKALAPPKAKNE